jgi:hypothetical protein
MKTQINWKNWQIEPHLTNSLLSYPRFDNTTSNVNGLEV